ncbi:hypothetical protein ACFWEG_26880, partial [Streptomyces sp. NPDC060194]
MVTFAQAQERAEEWINEGVPAYQHREVRVREFDLGFVVWAEDRADGPTSDDGGQRLVIARDSGEVTLWPGLPVGEVVRRYEEAYGTAAEPSDAAPRAERVDLGATSFLLSPPEWLQDAADKLGIGERPGGGRTADAAPQDTPADRWPTSAGDGAPDVAQSWRGTELEETTGARRDEDRAQTLGYAPGGAAPASGPADTAAYVPGGADAGSGAAGSGAAASGAPERPPFAPPAAREPAGSDTPWAGTDVNTGADSDDHLVPPPATVFAPPVREAEPADPEGRTALLPGGSALPPTAESPAVDANRHHDATVLAGPSVGGPAAPRPPGAPKAPGAPGAPGARA